MLFLAPFSVPVLTYPLQLAPSPYAAHVKRSIVATAMPSSRCKVTDLKDSCSSFFEQDSRPIMLFDGVCNLCNGGVQFVTKNDRNRAIRFVSLQSQDGKQLLMRSGRQPDDISSVVLVYDDRSYIKSEAVLKIMGIINSPFPQMGFFFQFIPKFVRDFVYDNVANNRYVVFGRSDSCEI